MLILLAILSCSLFAGQAEYDEYRYKVIKAEQDYLAHLNALPANAPAATFDKHRQDMLSQQSEARVQYDAVLVKEMNSKIDSALARNKKSNNATATPSDKENGTPKISTPQAAKKARPTQLSPQTNKEIEVDGMILLRGGKIRERKVDASTGAGEIKVEGAKELSFGKKPTDSSQTVLAPSTKGVFQTIDVAPEKPAAQPVVIDEALPVTAPSS